MIRSALLVVGPLLVWKMFFERVYWEYPPIDEDPAEVAAFKGMVDAFMRNEFRPLTEEQIDQYFRDGWITIDEFIPKPICRVLAKCAQSARAERERRVWQMWWWRKLTDSALPRARQI